MLELLPTESPVRGDCYLSPDQYLHLFEFSSTLELLLLPVVGLFGGLGFLGRFFFFFSGLLRMRCA